MEGNLVRGVEGIIIFPEQEEDVLRAADDVRSRIDDAYWSRRLREPFSWQLFVDWWASRRWVVPRDVRKW